MTPPLRLAIHGAAGRMGQRLIAVGQADPQIEIVGAVEAAGHPKLGQDAGTLAGVEPTHCPIACEFPTDLDAIIDFSTPKGAQRATDYALKHQIPLVMATTGLDESLQQQLRNGAQSQPICWAPSMSLAVNLTMKLAEICARTLKDHPSGTDVEIIERHHRFKEDSPSGTALKFGQIIANEMNLENEVHGREGLIGKKSQNEIGYHAVRVGDNPGEHTIVFGMLGETIELKVAASNRDCYAQGAMLAAKFVHGRSPGLYTMNDVLGLDS